MTISERIKEGLKIRNMKQVELVEKTGIGKGALSSYISGKYNPKQNNIYKIAKALDVNEAWLMGYDVPMERINQLNKLEVTNDELNLLNNYKKLNALGKSEANKRISELTQINLYTSPYDNKSIDEFTAAKKKAEELKNKEQYYKDNSHLITKASHDKKGNFTAEDYKHDDDLMLDDDLWK